MLDNEKHFSMLSCGTACHHKTLSTHNGMKNLLYPTDSLICPYKL